MSMGGCYVALDRAVLNSIVSNNESLSDYVFTNENTSLVSTCSLEQAWDAFRFAFSDTIDDIIGSEELEGVDLGESCLVIGLTQAADISHELNAMSVEQFKDILNSPRYQAGDFYWDTSFKNEDGIEFMMDIFVEMKQFFKDQVEKKKAIVFYVA